MANTHHKAAWVSLEQAAEVIGLTPQTLQRALAATQYPADDGVIESRAYGVRARRTSPRNRWRCQLSAGWTLQS